MGQKLKPLTVLLLCLALHGSVAHRTVSAQDKAQERDIEAKEVLQSRRRSRNPKPGRNNPYQSETSATQKKGTKTAAGQFPIGTPPRGKTYITVGVTLWRVRRATEAERQDPKIRKERMWLGQQEPEAEVTVERISDTTPITNQDLVQLGVEYLPYQHQSGRYLAERVGYLYVVNREQFADGSLQNARMIFPTTRTFDGDNRVLPGRTVMIPDPRRPFQIKRSSSGQVQAYETYTIIISPAPLDAELPQDIGGRAMELPPELVVKWERQWGAGEVRADLRGGVGQKRTPRELHASGDLGTEERGTEDLAEDLTQDDPPPQTVFRKVVRPKATMVVTVKLPFKEMSITQ